MNRPVAITSYATWTGAGARVRSAPAPSGDKALGPWPTAPALSRIHPRARRPHPSAVALVQLAHATLAGLEVPLSAGIILGTSAGCAAADRAFDESLRVRGMPFGSPSTFVYTLPSAAPGEVSIALGLSGPNLTVSCGEASALSAVAQAAGHVSRGRLEACLCGGLELPSEGPSPAFEGSLPDQLVLFLIQPATPQGTRLSSWSEGFSVTPRAGGGGALGLAAALAQGGPAEIEAFDPRGFWARVGLHAPGRVTGE